MRVTGFFVSLALLLALSACAPQREFVQFSDAGTFHPGPGQGGGDRGEPQGPQGNMIPMSSLITALRIKE